MIEVNQQGQIRVEWNDNPINYTPENISKIKDIISKRYNIDKKKISYTFNGVKYDSNGNKIDSSSDIIENIQDPKFQLKLFKEYIKENEIENVDFEYITTIDNELNSLIDYSVFDKKRRYKFNWIEWDYFLSYGPNNRLDFNQLNGLVLLNGSPANQSGKTTFAIDLLEFILFGKTSRPFDKLIDIFNRFCDDNKEVRVKSCLTIDNEDYIIERILTRTRKRNKTWGDASQTVKYYKLINGIEDELIDCDTKNLEDEYSVKTNKIIKETIGSLNDFEMIISATSKTLEKLIDTGDTEKGRLLSRWIGLLPIEKKEELAKNKFKSFSNNLYLKRFNKEVLFDEITKHETIITKKNEDLLEQNEKVRKVIELLNSYEQERDTLSQSKHQIDKTVLSINIESVNNIKNSILNEGKIKRKEIKERENELLTLNSITFDENEYKTLISLDKKLSIDCNNLQNEINRLNSENNRLAKSELCPILAIKCKDLDNTITINENIKKINVLTEQLNITKVQLNDVNDKIKVMDGDRVKYERKNRLEILIPTMVVNIENLLNKYQEQERLISEYTRNKEAIDINNRIDMSLVNLNSRIKTETLNKEGLIRLITNTQIEIKDNESKIIEKRNIINEIEKEEVQIKNWDLYLTMIGKNGISKMVLKNTLPIINSELHRLLDEVCDFDIEINVTEKNDVIFNIIKDDVVAKLNTGSGFEQTAASLALRHVLGSISTMPKPNFITLDEILGKVSSENYGLMKLLYDKIKESYQFIFHVTHISEIIDWHNMIVTVNKEDNISRLKVIK